MSKHVKRCAQKRIQIERITSTYNVIYCHSSKLETFDINLLKQIELEKVISYAPVYSGEVEYRIFDIYLLRDIMKISIDKQLWIAHYIGERECISLCKFKNIIVVFGDTKYISDRTLFSGYEMLCLTREKKENVLSNALMFTKCCFDAFIFNVGMVRCSFIYDLKRLAEGFDYCTMKKAFVQETVRQMSTNTILYKTPSLQFLELYGAQDMIWTTCFAIGLFVIVVDNDEGVLIGRVIRQHGNERAIGGPIYFIKSNMPLQKELQNRGVIEADVYSLRLSSRPSYLTLRNQNIITEREKSPVSVHSSYSFTCESWHLYYVIHILYRMKSVREKCQLLDNRLGFSILRTVSSIFLSLDKNEDIGGLYAELQRYISTILPDREHVYLMFNEIVSDLWLEDICTVRTLSGLQLQCFITNELTIDEQLYSLLHNHTIDSSFQYIVFQSNGATKRIPFNVDITLYIGRKCIIHLHSIIHRNGLTVRSKDGWILYNKNCIRLTQFIEDTANFDDITLLIYSTVIETLDEALIDSDNTTKEVFHKMITQLERNALVVNDSLDAEVDWKKYQQLGKGLVFPVFYQSNHSATEFDYIIYSVQKDETFEVIQRNVSCYIIAYLNVDINIDEIHKENLDYIKGLCDRIYSYCGKGDDFFIGLSETIVCQKITTQSALEPIDCSEKKICPRQNVTKVYAHRFRKGIISSISKYMNEQLVKYPNLKNYKFKKPLHFKVDIESQIVQGHIDSQTTLSDIDSAQLLLDSDVSQSGFSIIQKRTGISSPSKTLKVRKDMKAEFREKIIAVVDREGAYKGLMNTNVQQDLIDEMNKEEKLLQIIRTTGYLKRKCSSLFGIDISIRGNLIHLSTSLCLSFDGIEVNEDVHKELFFFRWMVVDKPHQLDNYHLAMQINEKEKHLDFDHYLSYLKNIVNSFEDKEITRVTIRRDNLDPIINLKLDDSLDEYTVVVRSFVILGADLVGFQYLYNLNPDASDESEILPWMNVKHGDRLKSRHLLADPKITINDIEFKHSNWRTSTRLDLPVFRCVPCILHLQIREAISDVKMIRYELKNIGSRYEKMFCRLLKTMKVASSKWDGYTDFHPKKGKNIERLYSEAFKHKFLSVFNGTEATKITMLDSLDLFRVISRDLRCTNPDDRREYQYIYFDIQKRTEIKLKIGSLMDHMPYYELILTQVIPLYLNILYIPMLASQEGHENAGKVYKHRVKTHSPQGGGNFSPLISYKTREGNSIQENNDTMNDFIVFYDFINVGSKESRHNRRNYRKISEYWKCKSKTERTLFNNVKRKITDVESPIEPIVKKSKDSVVGIQNYGNTCFAGSVLMFINEMNMTLSQSEIGEILLLQLLNNLRSNEIIEKQSLLNILPTEMRDGQQHDAFELLLHIFNNLSTNLRQSLYVVQLPKVDSAIRPAIYSFGISVSIDGISSVKEALSHECILNNIHYPIITAGESLIIQLLRWNIDGSKNNSEIELSQTLDVGEFMCFTETVIYNINCIICHEGTNWESGHYYVLTKRNDEWWKTSDDHTEKIAAENIITSHIYILLYRISATNNIVVDRQTISVPKHNISLTRKIITRMMFPMRLCDDSISICMMRKSVAHANQLRSRYIMLPVHTFSNYAKRGYSSIEHSLRNIFLYEYELVQIVVHISDHWCAISIWPKRGVIHIFDSLRIYFDDILSVIYKLIREYNMSQLDFESEMKWIVKTNTNEFVQTNNYDCGVFVVKSMYYHIDQLLSCTNYDSNDIIQFRNSICNSVIEYYYSNDTYNDNMQFTQSLWYYLLINDILIPHFDEYDQMLSILREITGYFVIHDSHDLRHCLADRVMLVNTTPKTTRIKVMSKGEGIACYRLVSFLLIPALPSMSQDNTQLNTEIHSRLKVHFYNGQWHYIDSHGAFGMCRLLSEYDDLCLCVYQRVSLHHLINK